VQDGSHLIKEVVEAFEKASSERCVILQQVSSSLVARLDVFNKLQEERKLVASGEVNLSLKDCLAAITEISQNIEKLNQASAGTVDGFIKTVNNIKIETKKIKKLQSLVSGIINNLAIFKNESLSVEIERFQSISTALEKSVNVTYTSTKEALENNAKSLVRNYEKFFAACSDLTETLKNTSQDENVKSLIALYSNIDEKLDNFALQYNMKTVIK
jgi:archaellum component FlaC